jgi:hypothetical protein
LDADGRAPFDAAAAALRATDAAAALPGATARLAAAEPAAAEPAAAKPAAKTTVAKPAAKFALDAVDSLPAEAAWELIERKMEQGAKEPSAKKPRKGIATGKKVKPAAVTATKFAAAAITEATARARAKEKAKSKTKPAAKDATTTPLPKRSAWLSFCAAVRPTLAAEGMSLGSAAKALSAQWAALDADGRAPFDAAAAALRATDAAAALPGATARLAAAEPAAAKLAAAKLAAAKPAAKPAANYAVRRNSNALPKPKRPVTTSAFRLYAQAARPAACEAAGTKQVGPVAQELSRRWAALDADARAAYERQAADANASAASNAS